MILSGPFLTEEELTQAIASLEARAEAAERNGLPKTAKSWRDTVENMRVQGQHERAGCVGVLVQGRVAVVTTGHASHLASHWDF